MAPNKNCPRKRTQGKPIQNTNKFYTKIIVYKKVFESCCQQVMRKQGKLTELTVVGKGL